MLTIAIGDINIPGAQQPLSPPKIAGWDVIEGVLMDDCDAKISVCGKVANLKVVHEHAKTSYFTNYKTFEDVVVCFPEIAREIDGLSLRNFRRLNQNL